MPRSKTFRWVASIVGVLLVLLLGVMFAYWLRGGGGKGGTFAEFVRGKAGGLGSGADGTYGDPSSGGIIVH